MIFHVYVKRDVDGTIIDNRHYFLSQGGVTAQRMIEEALPGKVLAFEVTSHE